MSIQTAYRKQSVVIECFHMTSRAAILVSQNNETAAMLVSQTSPLDCKRFLLFQYIWIDAGHVSETLYICCWGMGPYKGTFCSRATNVPPGSNLFGLGRGFSYFYAPRSSILGYLHTWSLRTTARVLKQKLCPVWYHFHMSFISFRRTLRG